MKQIFESPGADAVILVDATKLNRENALRKIQHLCPRIAKVLINNYQEDAHLYIDWETSCYGFEKVCRGVCPKESNELGSGDRLPVLNSHCPPTRCLCHLYPRSEQQVDIHG